FAQRPDEAKPAGRQGYVVVRGRPIRDPFILRDAEAGYRSTIAPGDRPSLILFLELPGDAVDVNVHPSKLEVRFRDKFFVEKVVEEAVRAALGPLVAAAPLGAGDSGLGAWAATGGSAVPLEMFAGDSRARIPASMRPAASESSSPISRAGDLAGSPIGWSGSRRRTPAAPPSKPANTSSPTRCASSWPGCSRRRSRRTTSMDDRRSSSYRGMSWNVGLGGPDVPSIDPGTSRRYGGRQDRGRCRLGRDRVH